MFKNQDISAPSVAGVELIQEECGVLNAGNLHISVGLDPVRDADVIFLLIQQLSGLSQHFPADFVQAQVIPVQLRCFLLLADVPEGLQGDQIIAEGELSQPEG